MNGNQGNKSRVFSVIENGKAVGAHVTAENGLVYVCNFGKPLTVRHHISTSEVMRLCTIKGAVSEQTVLETKIIPFSRKGTPCA